MELIISASGPDLNAPFEPRFGRCAYFILVETDSQNWQAFPNPAIGASGGAGTQAAQFVAGKGAKAVISGRFGPNAFQAFQAAGIPMYVANQATVSQALQAYLSGELQQPQAAAPAGHRGRH
jgi:predicted Fe-Mo cluster-binding NifX family protein